MPPELALELCNQLEQAADAWHPGAETAGRYASQVKSNAQLDRASPLFDAFAQQVIDALQANALFKAVALPMAIHSLLFSRCARRPHRHGRPVSRPTPSAAVGPGC